MSRPATDHLTAALVPDHAARTSLAACVCGSPFCAKRIARGLAAFCAMPTPKGCGCGTSYGIWAHSTVRHTAECQAKSIAATVAHRVKAAA